MGDFEDELRRVAGFLPAPAHCEPLVGPGHPHSAAYRIEDTCRPWSVRYAGRHAVLRRNDPGRFRAFGQDEETALASVEWLHGVLRDLAAVGLITTLSLRRSRLRTASAGGSKLIDR